MSQRRPGYEDWKAPPDISGETPETAKGHRIVIWLWIIGIVIFGLLIWGLGVLTTYMQPGHGDPFFRWIGGNGK
jgi:hypothetical protein